MKQLLFLLLLFLYIGSVSSACAQEIDLSIYPPSTEIIASSGAIARSPIVITNHGATKQKLSFSFKRLLAQIDGTASIGEENAPSQLFLLEKDGKPLDADIILRPSESTKLTLVTNAPTNSSDGSSFDADYYYTLLFQSKNEKALSQTGSKIEAGIGSNILLSVYRNPSDITKKPAGRIEEFSVNHRFYTGAPITFSLTIANAGPHFIKTEGELRLIDTSGHEVTRIALSSQNVLANSSRIIKNTISLPSKNLFGKYTAVAKIETETESLIESVTIYAAPKEILIIMLIVLSLLITIFARLAIYRKKLFGLSQQYKRRTRKM